MQGYFMVDSWVLTSKCDADAAVKQTYSDGDTNKGQSTQGEFQIDRCRHLMVFYFQSLEKSNLFVHSLPIAFKKKYGYLENTTIFLKEEKFKLIFTQMFCPHTSKIYMSCNRWGTDQYKWDFKIQLLVLFNIDVIISVFTSPVKIIITT